MISNNGKENQAQSDVMIEAVGLGEILWRVCGGTEYFVFGASRASVCVSGP